MKTLISSPQVLSWVKRSARVPHSVSLPWSLSQKVDQLNVCFTTDGYRLEFFFPCKTSRFKWVWGFDVTWHHRHRGMWNISTFDFPNTFTNYICYPSLYCYILMLSYEIVKILYLVYCDRIRLTLYCDVRKKRIILYKMLLYVYSFVQWNCHGYYLCWFRWILYRSAPEYLVRNTCY